MQRKQALERIFGVDVRSLAVLRIGLGLLLLLDLAMRLPLVDALYTDAGVMPRRLLDDRYGAPIPFHLADGGPGLTLALGGLAALAAVALIVGFHTRAAAILSWLLLVSFQQRNYFALDYGDYALRMVLFWALFLPLGAVASLDARRSPRTAGPALLSVASAAILVQVAFIYVFGGVHKSPVHWAPGGDEIFYAVSREGWVRPLGVWLREFPDALRACTPFVRYAEIFGPLLLFAPVAWLRVLAVLGFLGFQVILWSTFILGPFPPTNMLALVPFLPGRFWDRLGGRVGWVGWRLPDAAEPAAPRRGLGLAVQGLAGVLLLYVVAYNFANAGWLPRMPYTVELLGYRAGLNQAWEMFSPRVNTFSSWYEVEGLRRDGTSIDLLRGGGPLPDGRPEAIGPELHPFRMAIYMNALRKYPETARRFARWQCRQWNRPREGKDRVLEVELRDVTSWTAPPGGETSLEERRVLARESCRERRAAAGAAAP